MSTVIRNLNSVRKITGAGYWVSGFLLLGVFFGALGSLLILWDYHIEGDPRIIGLHFLGLSAGYAAASLLSQKYLARMSLRLISALACAAGFAGLLALSFLSPPVQPWWRILALAGVGFAGGALATALLFALEPSYAAEPARSLNRSGIFFGSGCLIATVLNGIVYMAGWHHFETVLLAIVPLGFLIACARGNAQKRAAPGPQTSSTGDLRLVAAFLFTLLLLFQFGNEWAIAGWLPLFLVHTLGSSPGYAIFALGLYFLALTLGRVLAQRVIGHVKHGRVLLAGILVAMSGYLLLSLSQSLPDAYLGIVITAIGFGPIYPLVLATLDERFSYQAGFYSRILTIAIAGGMSAPWLLGYVDAFFGMRAVMILPALGSIAVLVLALLMMLEARLMGGPGIALDS